MRSRVQHRAATGPEASPTLVEAPQASDAPTTRPRRSEHTTSLLDRWVNLAGAAVGVVVVLRLWEASGRTPQTAPVLLVVCAGFAGGAVATRLARNWLRR